MKSKLLRFFTLLCIVFLVCSCVLFSPILSSASAWAYQANTNEGGGGSLSDGGKDSKNKGGDEGSLLSHAKRAANDALEGGTAGLAGGAAVGEPGKGAAAGAIGKVVDGCFGCHKLFSAKDN